SDFIFGLLQRANHALSFARPFLNRFHQRGQTAARHVDHGAYIENFVKPFFLSAERYWRRKERSIDVARLQRNELLNLLAAYRYQDEIFGIHAEFFHRQIKGYMDRAAQPCDGDFL